MNPLFLAGIVAIAIASTFQYFLGVKRNRWIASRMSAGTEAVLKPKNKEYVNIGGAIGHNFTYELTSPWTSAKGTFTLSPRQSLLYLPFSLLIGVRDRLFMNLFTEKGLLGEGHIVEAGYLKKVKIDDLGAMERREVEVGRRRFVLLWKGRRLPDRLEALLAAQPEPALLRHFCCYKDNKTFFAYFNPRSGDIEAPLAALVNRLPDFFA